jgi:hypothetical protein
MRAQYLNEFLNRPRGVSNRKNRCLRFSAVCAHMVSKSP